MQGAALSYWDSLDQGVNAAVSNGRLGTPVFVRWTLLAADGAESVEGYLCQMAGRVAAWFGAPPERVYSLRTEGSGGISVSLEFDAGQTALLTAGLSHGRPSVDFILLGNEGAAYKHEHLIGMTGSDFRADDSEVSKSVKSLLHESLSTGKAACAR